MRGFNRALRRSASDSPSKPSSRSLTVNFSQSLCVLFLLVFAVYVWSGVFRSQLTINMGYVTIAKGLLSNRDEWNKSVIQSLEHSCLDSQFHSACTALGHIATSSADLKEAQTWLERALELDSSKVTNAFFLGQVLIENGQMDRAVSALHEANAGSFYANRGIARDSEPDLALALTVGGPAGMFYDIGDYYLHKEVSSASLARAAQAYRQAVELDLSKNSVRYWLARGEIAKSEGKRDEAEAMYARAVDIEPDNLEAYRRLVQLLYFRTENRKVDRAVYWAQQKAAHIPHLAEGWADIVAIYAYEHRYSEAELWAQQLQARFPEDSQAYFWLGYLTIQRRQWATAQTYLEQAIDLGMPGNTVHLLLVSSYVQSDQAQKAISHLESVLAQQPDAADLWFRLASLYQSSGDVLKAKTAYKQVLRLEPYDKEAQAAITELTR